MMLKLRWLFLIILACFFVLGTSVLSFAQSNADQLNQQGFTLLYNGNASAALDAWRQATEAYAEEENDQGVQGSKINQALAKQILGLYSAACFDLTGVLGLPSDLCTSRETDSSQLEAALRQVELSSVNQIGLRLLGENFRLFGSPHQAEDILRFAQDKIDTDSPEEARLSLALGSAYQMSVQEELHILGRLGGSDAEEIDKAVSITQTKLQKAIDQFELSATKSPSIATQSNLNLLNLFADTELKISGLPTWIAADLSLSRLRAAAEKSYKVLQNESFEQLPIMEQIEARLSFSRSLLTARQTFDSSPWNSIDLTVIRSLASSAIVLAKETGNFRAHSLSLGMLADISEEQGLSLSELELIRKQALAIAQSIQADELVYEWAYKLAKIYEEKGDIRASEQSYQQAIASLTQVRQDLIAVNSELRFNFREKIEAVYRDYLKFMLFNRPNELSQVVRIYESLQLAELENFLRCGRLDASSSAEQPKEMVTVYIINLGTDIVVIASNTDGYYSYNLPAAKVLGAAKNLETNIRSPLFLSIDEPEFLPYAQSLYNDLITPLEEASFISDKTPLTFVLDYPFQSIPMGILHDGENYLLKNYIISNSLRLNRTEQKRNDSNQALFAGLIQETTSDDPRIASDRLGVLLETEFEAEALKSTMPAKLLIDDDFTSERFQRALETEEYSIIHISTHGQFSSIPEETYLIAWDKVIDLHNLAGLFQKSPGNLLVLSACQAASGDERAVLGISGTAVQAGAHSAIASLWLVDATGSSVLVDLFYRGLDEGLGISEALHEAQVALMNSTAFSHPFYWASFLLVQS